MIESYSIIRDFTVVFAVVGHRVQVPLYYRLAMKVLEYQRIGIFCLVDQCLLSPAEIKFSGG